MFKLVIIDGEQKGRNIVMRENDKILIGRGEDCDLQLNYEGISRHHCSIKYQNDAVWLEECGSTNGTFVNSTQITAKQNLNLKDVIQIGTVRLQLQKTFSKSRLKTLKIDKLRRPPAKSRKTTKVKVQLSQILYRKYREESTFSANISDPMRMKRDLVLLHRVGKLVQQQQSIANLLNDLAQILVIESDTERGCIMLQNTETTSSTAVYASFTEEDFSNDEFIPNQYVVDAALREGEGTVSSDVLSDERFQDDVAAKKSQLCSIICAPIEGHNRTLGVIYLDSTHPNQWFDESDLDLITAIGRQAGLAIERIFLEEKLVASEHHYRLLCQSLIERSWNVLYRRKIDGSFLIISPSVHDLLGYTADEILKDSAIWQNCVHPEDKTLPDEAKSKILQGSQERFAYRMKRKDGNVIWIEEVSYPLENEKGEVVFLQGMLQDITQRKVLEDQLTRAQRMEALGILAGGVAHDLNNILGGLVGYPDMILHMLAPDSPVEKFIHGIKRSGLRAAEVVRDLLALARRENYSINLMDLNAAVKNYLDSLEFEARKKLHPKVKLNVQLSPHDLIIMGSISHLGKVIMNLITNAMQAMSGGGVLSIATDAVYVDKTVFQYDQIKEGEYATLKVHDTGEGIPKKDIKRIFEPFYSKKASSGGTGLGLAVVYGVVQDHRGHIDVVSTRGEGTTFTVYLPLQRDRTMPQQVTANLESMRGGEFLLVVDDVEEQRILAHTFLSSMGYRVTTVSSGEKAVEYIKKNPVDLIVLDMILEGGINGLETYRRMLEIRPGQKAIIASGFCNTKEVQEARALGVGDYVQKPYTVENLAMAVRKELDKK